MERTMPIIRLEVEGMKRTICAALMEHAAQMDTDIQAAVEAYCTPENIRRIVTSTAAQVLDAAIKEEVQSFFRYGDGRKAVAAAVKESLLNKGTYTQLDEV